MAQPTLSQPVEDSVPKVDNAVAVGEDLEFQERWWKFEHYIWLFFVVVLIADVAGVFGRGPVAKAERKTADGALDVKYERIQRSTTPSVMTIKLGLNAIQNGRVRLFVSQSVVEEMGAQRISPQPALSGIGEGGLTYIFPASTVPANIDIAFEPSFIGVHRFRIGVVGGEQIEARVVVLP